MGSLVSAKALPTDVRRTVDLVDAVADVDEALLAALAEASVRVGQPELLAKLRRAAPALAGLRSEVNIELNFPPKLRGARSRLYRR